MALTRPRAYQIYDLDYKQATRVVTTTNITLSGGAPNSVDGINLSINDRVLVTGQADAKQNGIYSVETVGSGSSGTWVRSVDTNSQGELLSGTIVMVTEGNIFADTQWKLITDDPITIGASDLTFVQNYSANSISSGTSNVVVTSNANVTISSGGTADVLSVSPTGAYVLGVVSATGNIAGNYVIGNGSQLTGLPAGYTNANLATLGSNVISTTGTITGGNINGSNLLTSGLISSTGNITSGNVLTGGLLSTGGNITAGTSIYATGNSYGANLLTAGYVSAAGNIISGNVTTTGVITSTGNITGGNISATNYTGTSVSVTGNITSGNLSVSTGTITVGSIVNANANGVGNIGSSTTYFNTVFAKATSAQYADLAEMYVADQDYPPGTVVEFGGTFEITASTQTHSTRTAGVISTNPSYLMNSAQLGEHVLPVALTGRVPCRVIGTIFKGDRLVAGPIAGVAIPLDKQLYEPGCIIGKALEDYDSIVDGVIEIAVGRY